MATPDVSKIEPVIFRVEEVAQPAFVEVLSKEVAEEMALVSYDDAYRFMGQNSPPHTPRRVTSTWSYLASRALGKSKRWGNIPAEISAAAVKDYSFAPSFIIDTARHTTGWLNRNASNGLCGYSRVSAPLLVDIANNLLQAEPPVPAIR